MILLVGLILLFSDCRMNRLHTVMSQRMFQSKSAEELSSTEAACKNTNVEFLAVRTNRN